jgi:hypothetical protein
MLGGENSIVKPLGRDGDVAHIRALYERAFANLVTSLGSEHPDTLRAIEIFANILANHGDLSGCKLLYERTLSGYDKVLGSDHPDTLKVTNNLANVLKDQGDQRVARLLYERALAGYEKVLGPDHPHTLATAKSLAAVSKLEALPTTTTPSIASTTDVTNVLPPFPKAGVTWLFLQRLREYLCTDPWCNPAWTTTNVCDNLIKPWTKELQCSLYELMEQKHQDVPHPELGLTFRECFREHATIFVSHAWKYEWRELVGAIETYLQDQQGTAAPAARSPRSFQADELISSDERQDDEGEAFWIDLAVNDQWNSPTLTYDWWSGTFASIIKQIGHTMLVLSPWDAPIPLTRAWCLWEIYCTLNSNTKLTIQLSKAQRELFQSKLRDDYEYIIQAFCEIDVRKSEAWKKEDRDMIFEAVEKMDGGFHHVNVKICTMIREWIADCTRGIVRQESTGKYFHTSLFS